MQFDQKRLKQYQQLSQNPEKTDYILRKSFPQFDFCSNEQTMLQSLKEESLKMISLFEQLSL